MLKGSGSCSVAELSSKVPVESARYHLFRFKHTYEGDSFNSNGGMRRSLVASEKTFYFSLHLLHAGLLSLHQGENALLQLQELRGGRLGEGLQHNYQQED